MKITILIASNHEDYTENLSKVLSQNHSDFVCVSMCTSLEKAKEALAEHKYDVALLEPYFIGKIDLSNIHLPLVLWTEEEKHDVPETLKKISKYQRVSSLIISIMEHYSKVSEHEHNIKSDNANITAVWSPVGGVGKTSVSLALAAKKASDGKQALYLNLEPFSSTSVYFNSAGKSISTVFDMIEAGEGNVNILTQGILRRDMTDSISYFCCPESFDDINVLSLDNVSSLITACSELTEELIIDMSSECNERTRLILEIADRVLLVADWTSTSRIKLSQFTSQHNVYARIKNKTHIIANKGAAINPSSAVEVIPLPLVQSTDASIVYRTLSANMY